MDPFSICLWTKGELVGVLARRNNFLGAKVKYSDQ